MAKKTTLIIGALVVGVLVILFNKATGETDRTHDPRLANIAGKCFTLLKDGFIHRSNDSTPQLGEATAIGAGGPCLPISVEEYERNPTNPKEPDYCEEHKKLPTEIRSGIVKEEVLGTFRKGAKIYVDKITRQGDSFENGYYYVVTGRIDGYSKNVSLGNLFNKELSPEKVPLPIQPRASILEECVAI